MSSTAAIPENPQKRISPGTMSPGTLMQAIVYEQYGSPDVLTLREVPVPTISDHDVRIRIHAAAIGAGDGHLLSGKIFAVRLYQGVRKPKRQVLGHEASGTVEAVGSKVTRFEVGDEVFGTSNGAGAFAEYMRFSEDDLVHKPVGVTHQQAAAAPVSALTALQGLRDKGRIQAGQRVLINGASGGVGTFAVQIAKSFGAEVTAVCSAGKMNLVRSIGADHVIDYGKEDFTTSHEHYDLVLDNVGNRPLADCKRTLRPGGMYVAVAGAPTRSLWILIGGGKNAVVFVSTPNQVDLLTIRELLESGTITPVIDRTFALKDVPDAMRYFGEGKTRGKLVIAM